MKIALINPTVLDIPLKNYGGIEEVVYNLAVELNRQGHDVYVCATIGSSFPEGINHIKTIKSNLRWNITDELVSYNIYSSQIKDMDIIHDHTHLLYSYQLKESNPNICSTLHNHYSSYKNKPPILYPCFIGVSKDQSKKISRNLGIPVKYVYNCIDLDKYISYYEEDKKDYYLFLSRITKEKGVHEAIQIARETNIKLYIAGEDIFIPDPKYVHYIKKQCTGNIKYWGRVSDIKKKQLLSKAKALIFPDLWEECFGLVLLEALACGTPVIATKIGALPEIIEHNKSGYLVDHPSEIKEYLDKVEDIDPKECLKRAERFSVEVMTNNYIKLYKQILKGDYW